MPRLSQGTPTAKDKTGEALNSTYVTGGVGHLLITILTFGTYMDIFYYLSSPGQLIFNPRHPQVTPRHGYNTRHLVLLPRLPLDLPRLRLQRSQP